MKRPLLAALTTVALLAALAPGLAGPAAAAPPEVLPSQADPVAHGLVRVKGAGPAASKRNPNMTYHGGKVMTTAVITSIFWGTSWATYTGDKMTGLDSFYAGHNGSAYARTVGEYTDTVGGGHTAGSTSTLLGHVIDTSAASGGGNTSTILAEVAKQVQNGTIVLDPAGNSYIPVYTDIPRGSAGYCAWHSSGTITKGSTVTPVQFAYFFKLDGDAGCDPADTSGLHSQGLAALANVSAHELEEAMSDPASPGAWYDGSGNENADKCAWIFAVSSVTLANGTSWRLQPEWSNKSYTAGTGYANASGQKGCIFGA